MKYLRLREDITIQVTQIQDSAGNDARDSNENGGFLGWGREGTKLYNVDVNHVRIIQKSKEDGDDSSMFNIGGMLYMIAILNILMWTEII